MIKKTVILLGTIVLQEKKSSKNSHKRMEKGKRKLKDFLHEEKKY